MTDLHRLTEYVIARCLSLGADMVKCIATREENRELNADNDRFTLYRTLFSRGLSITVFRKGQKGSIAINSFEDDDVEEAIADCLRAADTAVADEAWDLCREPLAYDLTDGCPVPDMERLFFRTKELKEHIRTLHPTIVLEQMIVDHVTCETVFRTSFGGRFHRTFGNYHLSLSLSAHEGEMDSSFNGTDLSFLTLDRPLWELGNVEEMLSATERQIVTYPLEEKFCGTMVLTADALADLAGSALDNFVSDSTLLDGTSIWKDKLGQKVADERLTLSCKPLDPRIIGGSRCTDDGFLAENYDILREGVLEHFMISLYTARKIGASPAPSDGFDLVMEGGDIPFDRMIENIDRGILVGRFSGGAPNVNGDFSGVAKNSFLIEKGKITKALRETMISGNLADLFCHVEAIASETVENGSYVLPPVAFGGVTVSGQ